MIMNKFHFNTGVKIQDNPYILGGVDSGNCTVVIPFEADVPKDAKLAFLSSYPNLHKDNPSMIMCEIKNTKLLSKYAYFNVE